MDSALTAAIAAEALGPTNVLGVAMPARYSSAHSLADAEALARALGIGYEVIPIDTVFQTYLDVLTPVLGGGPLGATEENVQARVRGAVLMAISNRRGSILLSTGNKSELAVGYCTLYGDMCGGLAVISDVPKMLVYRLARYVNREGHDHPGVHAHQTAQRRAQTRSKRHGLPAPVRDPRSDHRCLCRTASRRRGDCPARLRPGNRRRRRPPRRHQRYKRRQMAPGIKISSKAFGVGRRYPIAAEYRY